MKFRHSKIKPLAGTLIFVILLALVISLRDGTINLELADLWIYIPLAILIFGLKYGPYIFDKYLLDAHGLTVKKRFGANIELPFAKIQSVKLNTKEQLGGPIKGNLELTYGSHQKLRIELDNLKMRELFVTKITTRVPGK